MADINELVDKDGNPNQAAMIKMLEDRREDARAFAKYTAAQHAEVVIEVLKNKLTEPGMRVMEQGMGGLGAGWFEIDESTGEWPVDEVEPGYTLKFSPANSGMHGYAFESLLMGSKPNSVSLADFAISLSGENADNPLLRDLMQVEAKATSTARDSLVASKYATSWIESATVKERINSKGKLEQEFKAEVNEFVKWVIMINKIYSKMKSVMITYTHFITNTPKKQIFEYLKSVVYAQLDVDKVWDLFTKKNSGGFFTLTIKDMRPSESAKTNLKSTQKYNFGTVECHVVMKITAFSVKGSKSLYRDEHTIFDESADVGSRLRFFQAMRSVEKTNNLINKDWRTVLKAQREGFESKTWTPGSNPNK